MPLILWILLVNHHMAIPTSQLSVKSHKHFLIYEPKGGHNAAAAMGML